MICRQPRVITPVDFEGETLNILTDAINGKLWVCIDGIAVFRAKNLEKITIHDTNVTEIFLIPEYDDA